VVLRRPPATGSRSEHVRPGLFVLSGTVTGTK
jgi:hypothetical protein